MKPILIILGMHRSGTSALAGACELAGARIGVERLEPSTDNPAGYWENQRVVAYHEALFDAMGLTWDSPLPLPQGWERDPAVTTTLPALERLIEEELLPLPLACVKDPRLCRLLPLWRPVLATHGLRPVFLMIHRHPAEVAMSLARRDRLPEERSALLWARYVTEAERNSRGGERSVLSYASFMSEGGEAITRLWERHRLPRPDDMAQVVAAIDGHLSPALWRNRSDERGENIPSITLDALRRGLDALERGDEEKGGDAFDEGARLLAEIDRLAGPLMRTNDKERADMADRVTLLRGTLDGAEKREVHWREKYEEVIGSTTWRATEPLRRLVEAFRRITG